MSPTCVPSPPTGPTLGPASRTHRASGVTSGLRPLATLVLVVLATTACAGPSTRSLSGQVGISPGPPVEAAPPARDGQPRPAAGTWQGVVTRVTDGDTLRVEVTVAAPGSPPVGADVPVRLLRIDTPELGRGDQPVECLAEEARLALRSSTTTSSVATASTANSHTCGPSTAPG
jgi:endonuclease YncB( thermonuclease family)